MNMIPLLLVSLLGVVEPLGPGDHSRAVQQDGQNRTYLLHIPPKYDPKQPTPVVLAFHGYAQDAAVMVQFCGLSDKADKEGFIVVYPNGSGRIAGMLTWNAGNCCAYAVRNDVDDVAFTRALLDDLAQVVKVDAKRVYATGMSNGAMMCYRLASELSDRIAAIAPVSGPMGMEKCNPQRPVSVMHFHGTDDRIVPFNGGVGLRILQSPSFYSVEDSIRAWVKADGCPETPVVTNEPEKTEDGTSVQRKTYGPGKEDSEVVLFVISGGGHTWPGRDAIRFLGATTHNLWPNDLMWKFFKQHPMK